MERGINKLYNLLKGDNIDVRIISAKIFIELLNNNETLQHLFCEKFNFNPFGNVICLNWLPRNFKNNVLIDETILEDIIICSMIKRKNAKFWMWPFNEEKNENDFPDPNIYLIGIYIVEKNVIVYFFYELINFRLNLSNIQSHQNQYNEKNNLRSIINHEDLYKRLEKVNDSHNIISKESIEFSVRKIYY